MISSDNFIVFFDQECVLCSNFLKILLKIDRKQKLKFAALQSEYAKDLLPEEFIKAANYKSVAFLQNGVLHYYSSAVLHIFGKMGLPWSLLKIGFLLPEKWRDALYMKVSNNRYSWFGKSEQCLVPDPETQRRFVHSIKM